MKIFESIKNRNIDELAKWLDENFNSDSTPWWKWWDENYCNKCKSVKIGATNVFGHEIEYAYCELNGKCQFFKEIEDVPDNKQIIKMWLESECN